MVKSFKSILKRILIGVGIALILSYLKGNFLIGVNALEVSNYGIGGETVIINNTTERFVKNIVGNPFSVHSGTTGYILGTFAIQKVDGTSTSINIFPKQVYVNTNTTPQSYVCEIGSSMVGNSTFNGGSFTYKCPVTMGTSGITALVFEFQDIQTNFTSQYRLNIGSLMTYEIAENTNVNVDTSSTTSAINNQITNDNTNTQNIINNDNTNTQNIINNQNNNTQQQIESQKVCSIKFFDNSVGQDPGYLRSDGTVNVYQNTSHTSRYISVSSGYEYHLKMNYASNAFNYCLYNNQLELINCYGYNSSRDITISPTSNGYIRYSLSTTSGNTTTFNGYVCENGNQALADTQQEINNTLNDTSGVADSDINDLFSEFESSDTPITDLLTMPLTLIQAYISGMSGTCQSISLGRLYGNNLIVPCINIQEKIGSNLWTVIDILCSMFIVYNLSQLFITAFDSITSLKDNFSWLYGVEGKHIGSPSTRVERNSDLY